MVQLKQSSGTATNTHSPQPHHQEYFTAIPVQSTLDSSTATTTAQRWQQIKQAISPPAQSPMSTGTPDPLRQQLADQHNVIQCPDCTKPVLESALTQHSVNCQKIRDRAQQLAADGGRKRRLSDADDSSQQKKAKPLSLVLTLGDKQQQQQQQSPAGTQAPKLVFKDGKEKPHRPRGPIDLDKHCGVINDKGLPCSRSLTCKTHAMGAKRSVPHRSRPYDDLLADWQRAKMAATAGNNSTSGANGSRQQTKGGDSELDAEGDSPGGALSASVTPAAPPFATLPPALPAVPGVAVKEKKRKRKDRQGEYGAGAVSSGMTGSGSGIFGSGKERRTKAGGEGGKKGLLVVGEWEDVIDPSTTAGDEDLLFDSDEEVEAVLKGLKRVQPVPSTASLGGAPVGVVGRPLTMFSGGGAGFATASFFVGRNHRLARLRDTLGGVFATRG